MDVIRWTFWLMDGEAARKTYFSCQNKYTYSSVFDRRLGSLLALDGKNIEEYVCPL